ncbi:hypothetical protein [Mesorhizobium sp. 1B3]|uniref:hypothetical protein n=1 Tax=Mesorhizobium sp. 1B3 TaxID=3243599 RepID=UPI003D98805C
MLVSLATAEETLSAIVSSIPSLDDRVQPVIEAISAPVYLTSTKGVVTHFNKACVDFAGRLPEPGRDHWCVTWKLYTLEGQHLPHESCPMALAITHRQPVRGVSAVAERPDGTRVAFTPFPTPIFHNGEFAGAINIFVDIATTRQIDALRTQANRCRRLANGISDDETVKTLRGMADDYEAEAREIEQAKLFRN